MINAIEKIHSLDAFGSRPGLDRIKRFLDILGDPQDSLKFIHVAGTNGKGSTCAMISSVLTCAGYKTGLFISPYIVDFRERIQINGVPVSEEILTDAVERTFPILEKLREDGCIITEFEYVMALEFLIHKEAECDIVVLETGLGGLLDSTNVIKPPLCSVITVIGLDHTAILGNSIREIAAQKCGIIKSGSAAVTSEQCAEAMEVIVSDTASKGVPLIRSEDIELGVLSSSLHGSELVYKGVPLHLPLVGDHQIANAKTALAALETVRESFPFTDDELAKGFAGAVNPARFELLSEEPMIILDGAHNPNGIEALRNALAELNSKNKSVCILGMLRDKDSLGSVKLLSGLFDTVYTVTVNNPRTLTPDELAEICAPYFPEVRSCESVSQALELARERALRDDALLVICGSLYLAGEIRPKIIKK